MIATTETPTAPDVATRTPTFFETLFNHPAGFWFIFWGELAERCSYYGMMSIMARFISEKLIHDGGSGLGDGAGNTWVSIFKAACYFLPIAGGILADQYLGKYRLIVIFSIPYILGHLILSNETYWWTIVALGLLAMGSGVIKPNISTLMGMTYDQKRPGNEQLRSMAFGMFYMAINIGAAISYAVLPQIRDDYGYKIAFICPAVLMAISFVIFAAGKPFYAVEKIESRPSTPGEQAEKLSTLLRVGGLFFVVTFFWAVFDQSHTTWVYFARDFTDLKLLSTPTTPADLGLPDIRIFSVPLDFLSKPFSPEQFGVLNPILIVIFVPLLQLLWNVLERRIGLRMRPTDKMMLGFILTAMTMGVMALAGYLCGPFTERPDAGGVMRRVVENSSKVTIYWEVLAFVLLTAAEVLISVTGLELAFVAAPASLKSFVTALWLLTVGLANLFINAPVGALYPTMPPGQYFLLLTLMMVAVMIAFYFVAATFNRNAVIAEDAKKKAALSSTAEAVPPATGGVNPSAGIQDKTRTDGITDPDKK
ncbi:MAG: MFS transporter [Gemmataceae bacterium]|nr:MFS transporter [Gemmataceae bacterium]